MKRSSGVLMHISSLYGDYSIGSFGGEAKYFIDFLINCGFTYWQVLPFGVTDLYNSPYMSYSAFGGNPYFIDLNKLYEKGLLTRGELAEQKQVTPYVCEYGKLKKYRLQALMTASKRAKNISEIESFIEGDKYLKQFCAFLALKHANREKPWFRFETNAIDEEVLFLWKFIQFEFFNQWREIRSYANHRGIKMIGDLPIYVAYDSSDVWANRELFLLDEKNKPAYVAGVPPDYFSKTGQMWGNPLYNWDRMREEGYGWWKDRISHMLRLFDGVRIDHFRAFESYYRIPGDAPDARRGTWEKGPGKGFIDEIKKITEDKLIIAEDLGDITPEVTKLLSYSKFPGMRVFQFGFLGEDDNPHLPHNYINNCVAYTGTHDNNTLLGYLWETDDSIRKNLLDYTGLYETEQHRLFGRILRIMLGSSAGLVILPIQDILGFGSDTRLNTPGVAEGNWNFRITKPQLDQVDKAKFKKLNSVYKR